MANCPIRGQRLRDGVADMQARDKKRRVGLDSQELNTILAALRYYQEHGQGEPENRSDRIHEIATNGDEEISMDAEAIDKLCERLNCG